MAKLKSYQLFHQFNHTTVMHALSSLIPREDELRRKMYDMAIKNNEISTNGVGLTGTTVDEEGYEVSTADLWNDDNILDTDDPGLQQHLQEELDLFKEVEEKYKGKPGHEMMMTYITALRADAENLKQGIPIDKNVCETLFGGETGLMKMKDVLFTVDNQDLNKKDPFNHNYKEAKVYEKAATSLGITALYEQYNETWLHGIEWQKEWQNGNPDPEKLEEISKKIRQSIPKVEEKLKHFEQEYFADEKLPEAQRRIYNVTSKSDVNKKEFIITEEEYKANPRLRAPNGSRWEAHKVSFERVLEKQLLAARLMRLEKSINDAGSPALKENTKKLIHDCLFSQRNGRSGKEQRLSEKDHYDLLDSVRQEASRLAKNNPAVKDVVEAADRYMQNSHVRQAEAHNADKWIENYQKAGFELTGPDGKKGVNTDRFVDIMAARMLVNSVRGDKKSLSKSLSAADIAAKAKELKGNDTFKGFLEKLNKDPKAMQKALSAAKSGHGGGLDDLFRDHVKNLPAGKLENTPLMERYLPTVKERIEVLQAQVTKEGIDGSETLHRKAAEIIALRNLAKAERGKKKSLEKPIPVSKPGQGLTSQMTALSKDPLFQKLCNNHWNVTMSLITEGHGGALGEYLRAPDREKPVAFSDARKVLYANSIHGRIDEIKAEARALRQNPGNNLRQKAGKLLAEYLALDVMSRDPKTAKIDETKFNSDIPYSRLDKAVNQSFTQQPQFNNYMKSIDEETLRTKFLDDIVTKNQDDLIKDIGKGITEVQQKKELHAQAEKNKNMERQTDAAQAAPKKNELGAQ